VSVKDVRASVMAVRASLRTALASAEMLDQQILKEQGKEQDREKLHSAALWLIKDQQAFIAKLAFRYGLDMSPDRQEVQALDNRASAFTFIENFPQTKKESSNDDDQ